jgi:D-arabinose 1-dehydrogenase-like Zn-dependent alcohol dehydrogenase
MISYHKLLLKSREWRSSIIMQAAVVPAIHGKWEVKDVPTPHPATNQVLIKIHASGLCYTDVHITEGHLPTSAFPRTIGHEPAGEIVEVGSGVTSRKIGDRVGVPWVQASCGRCEWCQRGKPMFCAQQIATGINTPGSHAEYMVASADATTLLPNGISYEQAAPVFCAGYTVWSGLRFADPKPHEKIAVLGIGGLRHLAIQFSKAAGFFTIGITHSKDKEELARKLGSDMVVSNGDALKRAGGADVILVTSNSYNAESEVLKGLRPDGRLVLMGVSAEPLVVTAEIIGNRSRIIGSTQNGPE